MPFGLLLAPRQRFKQACLCFQSFVESSPSPATKTCFRSSADQRIPLLMGRSQVGFAHLLVPRHSSSELGSALGTASSRFLPEVPKWIKALTICRVTVMSKPSFYASSSRSSSLCFTFDKTSPSSWVGMTVSNCLNLSIASEMRSHIFESNGDFDIE